MEIFFFFLSSIILCASFSVIFARNPIHSVLFLILVFVSIVFLLFSLKIDFLALVFLIVYVGAVAVLFLFIVMMLNIKMAELSRELIHYTPIGCLIGGLFFCNIYILLFKNDIISILNINSLENSIFSKTAGFTETGYDFVFFNIDFIQNIESFGQLLYTYFFYPFMLAGIVLLIAMIGALILTDRVSQNNNFTQENVHQWSRRPQNAIFLATNKTATVKKVIGSTK